MAESRERDLVLNPNEYAYIQDGTKGLVSCAVGSYKMSLSNTDVPVIFNEKTAKFEGALMEEAIKRFVTAPENWYVVLKNPAVGDAHPTTGTVNNLPELQIGKKVNIQGPVSFALFPGQMAKVVRGHRMHSNQYLKARVYNAQVVNDALEKVWKEENAKIAATIPPVSTPEEGAGVKPETPSADVAVPKPVKYVDGQIIIIKGNECPFYIPPTGIEVIPINNNGNSYVRDAVTLENLEYCVKKKESGERIYISGPCVVFPEPDEYFEVNEETGRYQFHAYELSDTSGIYVKVLMDYTDEKGKAHKAGEELFITGKDQMIYYPRKEHAIIDYNGKVMNYAIALPKGEGRYVLDRKTGAVDIVYGPAMFLPNPVDQVIVRRRLTRQQCDLWFPGSQLALAANGYSRVDIDTDCDNGKLSQRLTKSVTGGHSFSRGTMYTEPRTIEIGNKYKGVVSINVWTGYAINVINRTGGRRLVVGPATCILEYDETLEALKVSTGKPKNTDRLESFVFLKTTNNKISDIISVQTKDFVDMNIKVSYCVDFLEEYSDRWFAIENYVKYLTDRVRSIMRGVAKKYDAEEFYANATEIVRSSVLGGEPDDFMNIFGAKTELDKAAMDFFQNAGAEPSEETATEIDSLKETPEVLASGTGTIEDEGESYGMFFEENGMMIHDVEVLRVTVLETKIGEKFLEHQGFILDKTLSLSKAEKEKEYQIRSLEISRETEAAKHVEKIDNEKREQEFDILKQEHRNRLNQLTQERVKVEVEASAALLPLKTKIFEAKHEQAIRANTESLRYQKEVKSIEGESVMIYGEMLSDILEALSPDLVASLNNRSNSELVKSIMEAMAPYAIANDESVVDTTIRLTRGTPLESSLKKLLSAFENDNPIADLLSKPREKEVTVEQTVESPDSFCETDDEE